ncbi:MAG: peptidase U32 family protein [Rubrivivax sp.]
MPRAELELLSPARDADIGIEAVNHGADAVYIGGPGFGARDKASNRVTDIARLVRHAHRWHARVFVTLNTILRDDELEPARRLTHQLYDAGVDALIVQDMGLLDLDLPPIQLHASTQTDIRTPDKARFLQDVGFAQMVLARELTLAQIQAIAAQVTRATLEFFVHGALCVAYSGQCFISHALNGRSANRGNCSQECRQAYTVTDTHGRVVAHDKHVLSLKDNDQSANLAALLQAGIRSFKIEGRYKDMATIKNVTAHYRQLLDALMDAPTDGHSGLRAASSGRTRHFFTPDPQRGFNRGATDYFVNGRQIDIGAFDSPKHAGLPLGQVLSVGADHVDIQAEPADTVVHNGDAITWWDLQGELQGVPVNVAQPLGHGRWRLYTQTPISSCKDLRRDTAISRNRDMGWERLLDRPSAERSIPVDLILSTTPAGLALDAVDADGHHARVERPLAHQPSQHPEKTQAAVQQALGKLGGTLFSAASVTLAPDAAALFVPLSETNALRRDAVAALEAARDAAFERLPPAQPVQPPAPYPEDTLSYLANVYNSRAAAFYARHGVKLIAAAYESHEETGDVPLMITRHCVRWSLSLCPKQAKGVIGVQGTVRAEPMTLTHGSDTFTLRFDCKPCEMHVVGKLRKRVVREAQALPITFYRTRGQGPGQQSPGKTTA